MEKTSQEILEQILSEFPEFKDYAQFSIENDEIKYNFKLNYLKYDVSEDMRFFSMFHSEHEYVNFIDKFLKDLYFYVLNKCHSKGIYTIDYWNNRFKTIKKDEIEAYHLSTMTKEEKEQYIERQKKEKRNQRNHYLEDYIDAVVSNPLRWADLSEKEQQEYKDYRRYLLDYTEQEEWWKANPLTLDEWKDK